MGRKEYFETLEYYNMLKKDAVKHDENMLIDGMNKRDYLKSIDNQIAQIKKMACQR
ncbi:hypothetical protein K4L44_06740 [Halosquirtibacter laminarini]|uniref:Uncharacterized protein n=1 Tax=Halosquirtibacter laminarini TaxID=3374600 RepID=A0AC61NII7_9BACT|nr:hypothetical protein K4L44_06740 [Prolixibacteraceae bacterium]